MVKFAHFRFLDGWIVVVVVVSCSLLDLVRRRLKVDSVPARLEDRTGCFLRTGSHCTAQNWSKESRAHVGKPYTQK